MIRVVEHSLNMNVWLSVDMVLMRKKVAATGVTS